jgi:hypothetical protein
VRAVGDPFTVRTSTRGGRAELDNRPDDPRALDLTKQVLNDFIPKELRAPLPKRFQPFQEATERQRITYLDMLGSLTDEDWENGAATTIVGYGLNVP